MTNKDIATHIFLTGGLGNQLFQLAAALDLSEGGEVFIHDKLGKPRTNFAGIPEIESLVLPLRVKPMKIVKHHHFISKVIGFNLRSGFNPTKFEVFLKTPTSLVSNFIMSLYLGKSIALIKSSTLGFDSKIIDLKSNSVLIGYFQTFKYIGALGLRNFILFPTKMVQKVQDYRNLADGEKPLIVHVRLGDYSQEADIGILSPTYYESCLREVWDPGLYGMIWLFSDDPEKALERIPSEYHPNLRVVDSSGLSSAETLQIMTFGEGYVIANSTFSWWGAYLRENEKAAVYCPHPWFKNMQDPTNIAPDQWNRMNGFNSVE